ncbi:Long chronological lifespan protein 2 [Malassezia furfur]|uniref:Long chronological lifespan protein 2 n=1 Tax=Malassezia furfur TaxID=55194 RepID=A0ABY8EQY2_MALFU|nr:Long chronological lifespan protein 2 [Malassezia furfur]
MFQQGGAGHNFFHTGGEQEAQAVGDASWFQERVRNAKCNEYLCSDTLACVSEPSECPCPYAEQTRCKVGDSYVCVTSVDCRETHRLYHLSE